MAYRGYHTPIPHQHRRQRRGGCSPGKLHRPRAHPVAEPGANLGRQAATTSRGGMLLRASRPCGRRGSWGELRCEGAGRAGVCAAVAELCDLSSKSSDLRVRLRALCCCAWRRSGESVRRGAQASEAQTRGGRSSGLEALVWPALVMRVACATPLPVACRSAANVRVCWYRWV